MPKPTQDPSAGAPLAAVPVVQEDVVSSPFRCTCFRQGVEAAWVKAFGVLDLVAAPELDLALRDALASAQLVVLDLSEVSFIDVMGVHVVVDTSVRAVCDGRRLLLAFVPAHVDRTFVLTGTSEAVEMLDLDLADDPTGPRPGAVTEGPT